LVAFTAAAFPWIFVSLYFVFVMRPPQTWWAWDTWKETLLVGRFASPTSAGVLFSMLAAVGLSATWLFRKARILAIFDDLDTVLRTAGDCVPVAAPRGATDLLALGGGLRDRHHFIV
jgi:hypothetical protein